MNNNNQSIKTPKNNESSYPYHCADCKKVCQNFGKTAEQAYDFNHGNADQVFGAFFNG
jgi:hypothetical protein